MGAPGDQSGAERGFVSISGRVGVSHATVAAREVVQTKEIPADSTQHRVEIALQSFTETTRTYADVVREVPLERDVPCLYLAWGCQTAAHTVLQRPIRGS